MWIVDTYSNGQVIHQIYFQACYPERRPCLLQLKSIVCWIYPHGYCIFKIIFTTKLHLILYFIPPFNEIDGYFEDLQSTMLSPILVKALPYVKESKSKFLCLNSKY